MPLVLEALTTLQCGKTNDVKIPTFLQNKSSVLRTLLLTAVFKTNCYGWRGWYKRRLTMMPYACGFTASLNSGKTNFQTNFDAGYVFNMHNWRCLLIRKQYTLENNMKTFCEQVQDQRKQIRGHSFSLESFFLNLLFDTSKKRLEEAPWA